MVVNQSNVATLFVNLRSNHIRKFLRTKKRPAETNVGLFLKECFTEYFKQPENQWLMKVIKNSEYYGGGTFTALVGKFNDAV